MIFFSPLLQLLPNFRTQQIHHTSGNCRTICKSNEITWIENEGGRVKNRIVPFVVERSGGNNEDGWGAAREKEREGGGRAHSVGLERQNEAVQAGLCVEIFPTCCQTIPMETKLWPRFPPDKYRVHALALDYGTTTFPSLTKGHLSRLFAIVVTEFPKQGSLMYLTNIRQSTPTLTHVSYERILKLYR